MESTESLFSLVLAIGNIISTQDRGIAPAPLIVYRLGFLSANPTMEPKTILLLAVILHMTREVKEMNQRTFIRFKSSIGLKLKISALTSCYRHTLTVQSLEQLTTMFSITLISKMASV